MTSDHTPGFFRRLAYNVWLGLFGRAFVLLFFIIIISLLFWLFAFYKAQEEPRAEQIADRASTAYNIAYRSLRFVPIEHRPALVLDLATIGDTQVFPRELDDITELLPDSNFWHLIASKIRQSIDEPDFIIASSVNDVEGLWLSMKIDDELYWLLVRHPPLFDDLYKEWIHWTLIAVAIAILGSALLTLFANAPFKSLTKVIKSLGRGEQPPVLPTDRGPRELRELFTDINHMVEDLRQADSDRQIMLGGISHDLRTPLARMRLEIEMSEISEESKQAIDGDIAQINHCIGQLLEYSRPSDATLPKLINVSEVLAQLCERERSYTKDLQGEFSYQLENKLFAHISEINLQRIVGNLIENARRYGRTQAGEIKVALRAYTQNKQVLIDVMDYGAGVNTEDIPRLLRPFARGDVARTGVSGAGLGLAICERLLKQVGGSLKLLPNKPNGLLCRIEIPLIDNRNIQLEISSQ